METKKQIRRRILTLRDAMGQEERAAKSERIAKRLFALAFYREAKRLLLYASYQSEVETRGIFERAVSEGRQVYFPLCKGREMSFYRVTSWDMLGAGYQGILEPPAEADARFTGAGDDGQTLMLMPGAVFDEKRNRIGYGGGFYDRYLAEGFAGKTIALGFDLQILRGEEIPAQTTDIRPDMILTEEALIDEQSVVRGAFINEST